MCRNPTARGFRGASQSFNLLPKKVIKEAQMEKFNFEEARTTIDAEVVLYGATLTI